MSVVFRFKVIWNKAGKFGPVYCYLKDAEGNYLHINDLPIQLLVFIITQKV